MALEMPICAFRTQKVKIDSINYKTEKGKLILTGE